MSARLGCCLTLLTAAVAAAAGLPILQGPTGRDQAQISVLVDAPAPPSFQLIGEVDGKPHLPATTQVFRWQEDQPTRMVHLLFTALAAGQSYRLVVLDEGNHMLDQRRLRLLDSEATSVTVAIAACMSDDETYRRRQEEMWRQLHGQRPDLLLLIGDNVYDDLPTTPAALWQRYCETRRRLWLYQAPELIPTLAVWDDHDYGSDEGSEYEYREQVTRIFNGCFPQRPIDGLLERGPGVATQLTAFGQHFFLLDDRSFRSPKKLLRGKGGEHFGAEQLAWLWARLAADPRPAWLISGDQFFGAYHRFDSFAGRHPQAFAAFAARLQTVDSPVFLVSGDRHLAELMQIEPEQFGYRTYELTTSSIHAKLYPSSWDKHPNPRQLLGIAGSHNYAMVTSQRTGRGLDLDVAVWGPRRHQLFAQHLTITRTGE